MPGSPDPAPGASSPARTEVGRRILERFAAGRAGFGRVALLLLAVDVVVHGVVLGNGFVLDDHPAIVANPAVNGQGSLLDLFTRSAWAGPLGSGNYRPLTSLSYAVQWAFSSAPAGFHLVDLALNAAVALVLYRLVVMLGAGRGAALAGALLFLVHPVHTEVVASVVGRMELLACLFGLLAVIAVLVERRPVASAALLFLAAASKESGAGFWGLTVLAAWLAYPRRSAWLRVLPGLLAVLAFVALRRAALGALGVPTIEPDSNPVADAPTATRLLTALSVQAECLRLLVWPLRLSHDYSWRAVPVVQAFTPAVAVGLLSLLVPVVAGLWLLRRRRPMGLVVLAHPTTLLLTSNLVVPIGTLLGERLLFAPSLTVCVLAGWGLVRLAERLAGPTHAPRGAAPRGPAAAPRAGEVRDASGRAAGGAPPRTRLVVAHLPLVALLLAFSLRSHLRDRDWRDTLTLHLASMEAAPDSVRLNLGLAIELRGRRRFDEALAWLERAEALAPDHLDVHLQRGLILLDRGELDAAESAFLRAHAIRPAHFVAPRMLAAIHEQRGDAEAAALWRQRAEQSREGMER